MSKKKFPKWFSPYSKPYAPSKPKPPPKEVQEAVEIGTFKINFYVRKEVSKLLETISILKTADWFEIRQDTDTLELVFFQKKNIPNPHYDNAYQCYQKDIQEWPQTKEAYQKEVEEWKRLKLQWDTYQKEKQEKHDRHLFEVLQRKFKDNA